MNRLKRSAALFIMMLIAVSFVPYSAFAEEAAPAENTVLSESTFESDSFEGWSAFGGRSKIALSKEMSHSGSGCLAAIEREVSWSGPTINVGDLFTPTSGLSISAYVIGRGQGTATIQMTLKTVSNGIENFHSIAAADVSNTEWTRLEGTFSPTGTISDANLYIETLNGTSDFCIDDVVIVGIPKPEEPENTPKDEFSFSFEEGIEGWMPRGVMSLEVSDKYSYKGTRSLYAFDRSKYWNAPMLRIGKSVLPNVEYVYSAYVMYNGKEYEDSHVFQMKMQYVMNGETIYSNIAYKELQKGTWSKLSGHFIIPEEATDVFLYIQTDDVNVLETEETINDLLAFYVDDVRIQSYTIVKKKKNVTKMIIGLICSVIVLGAAVFAAVLFMKRTKKRKDALRSASMDAMTNTYNRNIFEEKMRSFEETPDKAKKVWVNVCDVNSLKYINDNYGHENGDRAIIRCASVLLSVIGRKGSVYRVGGDEFICLCDADLTEEIKKEVTLESGTYKGYPFDVAVGTACYNKELDGNEPDIKEIIARADKEMYKHKQQIKAKNNF